LRLRQAGRKTIGHVLDSARGRKSDGEATHIRHCLVFCIELASWRRIPVDADLEFSGVGNGIDNLALEAAADGWASNGGGLSESHSPKLWPAVKSIT
jgi:hypothetical protein